MGKIACGMDVVEARGLPAAPLDAAAEFAARYFPILRGYGSCMVILDHADHTHDSWRKAAIEELAREAAPGRINAVVGSESGAIAQVLKYLDDAPGVTGQIFTLAE
ncbi:Rossmann fold domain-containing protein [Erythrobacter alti]|uniref:Rossmann fold domain-containing protein n=1 Tax=Erythrobacter alti TaxID=1896145 RepID=UPI0030F45919